MPDFDWTHHVFAVPLRGKRFGAIQVVPSEEKTGLTAVALDGFWDHPPTLEEALADGALRTRQGPCLVHCSEEKPLRRFVDLGVGKAAIRPQQIRAYGSLYGFAAWIELEREWRFDLTADERARAVVWKHDPEPVELDFGGSARVTLRRDTSRLHLGPEQIPPGMSVDWTALDLLPYLTELSYQGTDWGILEYVQGRRQISALTLAVDGSRLDVPDLKLRALTVSGKIGEIRLPLELHSLTLRAPGPALAIRHPAQGAGLSLTVCGLEEMPPAIRGLSRIAGYNQSRLRRATIGNLAFYPLLQELRLDGAPGKIDDVEALVSLSRLDHLILHDFYDFDARAFPTAAMAPTLSHVQIWGHRSSVSKELRQRLADYWMWELRGGKNDDWIAENADNPFRDWVDRDPALGKRACALYRATFRGLKQARRVREVHKWMDAFVEGLNGLDARYGFDTVDREDSFEAFGRLVAAVNLKLDMKALDKKFDSKREF